MDNSNAARVPSPTTVPYSKIRVLVLQSTIPTVLLYRIEPTTVPTVQYCTAVSTTYYLLPTTYYLLLPNTYYQATTYSTTSCLLPTAHYLLPATCYLLPTTYYRLRYLLYLPTTYCTYYLLPATYYILYYCTYYLLPTTYYLLPSLASTDRRRLQLGSWPSLLGRVPPLGLIYGMILII